MVLLWLLYLPVQFDEICLELDIYVARDSNFYHDLVIGRNAVEFPDIEIITDSSGSRLIRKSIRQKIQQINTVSILHELMELNPKIEHLNYDIQKRVKDIFRKFLQF